MWIDVIQCLKMEYLMQSMTDKKRDFETACAAAVKVRNFTEAAKATAGAADCAEILHPAL